MFKQLSEKIAFRLGKTTPLAHSVDIHSHLIPAIDDGVKSLDSSVDIIRQLQALGFKKIITTPHIMSHRFPNTKEIILKGYHRLQKELKKQEINIELEVAAEYYYDEYFLELIKKNEIMSFGEKYVLFELSYTVKPFVLEQSVAKLIALGYKPVLAHPERYNYFSSEKHYRSLKEMGLAFQINAISTQGFYGPRVKKAVEKIIDLGLVDFIGSDIHSQKYFESFARALQSKSYAKLFKKNSIKNNYL